MNALIHFIVYFSRLCIAFRHYLDTNILPKLQLPTKLPSSHSARWNSRAIYVLLGYFLLPEERPLLKEIAKLLAVLGHLHGLK